MKKPIKQTSSVKETNFLMLYTLETLITTTELRVFSRVSRSKKLDLTLASDGDRH